VKDSLSQLIELNCKQLKLSGLKRSYKALARDAAASNKSHIEFLNSCLLEELRARRENVRQTRLKAARFREIKTPDAFDFIAIPDLPKSKVLSLADGLFIKEKVNVICIGPSGTGKTHIATAIGVAAIEAGYRVRYINVVRLVQELLLAQSEYRLPKYLKTWDKFDLVILDELGYLGLGPGGPLLFQFCSERYERGSLIITSNLEFGRWSEVFGEPGLTTALLDRITHHSEILLFQGESYRFKESTKRHSGQ
jgi:DNA replication protein DnaC